MNNDSHIQCEDCGKCLVSEREEWCSACDYWGCEGGPDCADAKPANDAPPAGNPGGLATAIEARNIQRAQEVCAETLRDLPDDTELDVAFAEFKRRIAIANANSGRIDLHNAGVIYPIGKIEDKRR